MPNAELSPDQPCWQIQARAKDNPLKYNVAAGTGHANQWVPVCVENADITPDMYRHQVELCPYKPYHYISYEAALAAFNRYLELEVSLPALIVRAAYGEEYKRLLDMCEIRFVQVGPVVYNYRPSVKELTAG